MVTSKQLDDCKRYMQVDGDDPAEDGLITALMEAAQVYLRNAGIEYDLSPEPLYNVAWWSLTLHYYDHRSEVSGGESFPVGLRPIINQLKVSCAIRNAVDMML